MNVVNLDRFHNSIAPSIYNRLYEDFRFLQPKEAYKMAYQTIRQIDKAEYRNQEPLETTLDWLHLLWSAQPLIVLQAIRTYQKAISPNKKYVDYNVAEFLPRGQYSNLYNRSIGEKNPRLAFVWGFMDLNLLRGETHDYTKTYSTPSEAFL